MKSVFRFLLLLVLPSMVGAQAVVSDDVATVKLASKVSVISQKRLDDAVRALAQSSGVQSVSQEQRREVLEQLIDNELLKQAADRDQLKASEAEVLARLRDQLVAQQVQAARAKDPRADVSKLPTPTDDQVKQLVETQNKTTWAKLWPDLAYQIGVQKYMEGKKKDFPKIVLASVTEDDLKTFLADNATEFVLPETIRFSQIFFDTVKSPSGTVEEVRKKADEVRKMLGDKQNSFEDLVDKYSQDQLTKARNGDAGFLARALDSSTVGQSAVQFYGRDFLHDLFALDVNEVGLLKSKVGYHLVKITVKREKRFLGLDDAIQPGSTVKVRDQVRKLVENVHAEEYNEAISAAVVAELRQQAGKNIQYLKKVY